MILDGKLVWSTYIWPVCDCFVVKCTRLNPVTLRNDFPRTVCNRLKFTIFKIVVLALIDHVSDSILSLICKLYSIEPGKLVVIVPEVKICQFILWNSFIKTSNQYNLFDNWHVILYLYRKGTSLLR